MEDLRPDPEGKNASRKYKLALISLGLLATGWLLSSQIPALASIFTEFSTSILGVIGIYYTGNVANKHVVGKHVVGLEQAKGDENGTN